MPIRREFRHFYSGAAWTATRARILKRAKNCCEQCGKPNKTAILTGSGGYCYMVWALCTDGPWRDREGKRVRRIQLSFPVRLIVVVLTIAHLNHTPGDDRDENLKALCQWCHLNYDKIHHHETRAARKDAARPLLAAEGGHPGRGGPARRSQS